MYSDWNFTELGKKYSINCGPGAELQYFLFLQA
jgi:hypothetical protein